MPIRATVWGENVHEQKNKVVAENYPNGMHGQIAKLLGEDSNIVASTVTLQDPEHGMTEKKLDETDVLVWWGHAAHHHVDDAIVERVAAARVAGHGADRAPLWPPLEDLQAPDGRAGQPPLARGRRARAPLGGQSGPPDRQGPAGRISSSRTKRCTASPSPCPSRSRRCSSPGSRAAKCSAPASPIVAAPATSSTSAPATRPIRPITTRPSAWCCAMRSTGRSMPSAMPS